MKYHFQFQEEENGRFSAFCIELDGCFTEGDSFEDLLHNMQEALDLYIDEPEPEDGGYLSPLPNCEIKSSRNIVEVRLDPTLAFGLLLKHERIGQGKRQEDLKKEMGFDRIYSYQRLEKKVNAGIETIDKVKQVFPNFPVEKVFD
ncbi:MAG: putative RNase H-like HicB family nuclease [Halioglobus sp.]|jgi:predicted RNase H-like HicB family nuclease